MVAHTPHPMPTPRFTPLDPASPTANDVLRILAELVAERLRRFAPGEPPANEPQPVASPDFASVNWYGRTFTFSPKQRLVVAELWDARQRGYKWVAQETLLERAESDCGRVRDLFRGHPAWKVMFVSGMTHGGAAGSYRLADPPAWAGEATGTAAASAAFTTAAV